MISERRKEFRETLNFNKSKFAESLGVLGNTYFNYENGRDIPLELIDKLANKYNLNTDWLLTGRGTMFAAANGKTIQPKGPVAFVELLTAKAAAGGGVACYDIAVVDQVPVPLELIQPFDEAKVKAVRVKGDSMTPTIYNGDFILYMPGMVEDNGIYIIDVMGEYRCKRVEFRSNGDLVLISDNSRYKEELFKREDETIRICGKVIGWMHRHQY